MPISETGVKRTLATFRSRDSQIILRFKDLRSAKESSETSSHARAGPRRAQLKWLVGAIDPEFPEEPLPNDRSVPATIERIPRNNPQRIFVDPNRRSYVQQSMLK